MPATRVLIFPLPRLLHDVLHQLLADIGGIQVVDWPSDTAGIVDAAARSHADLVIAGEDQARPDEVYSLLQRMPHTRALAVSHDGRTGVIYELRPDRRPIGELSAATIRAAVLGAGPAAEQRPEPTPSSAR